ncbi:MAG TPA: hypothetical protein VFK70_01470, partial [Vicinamibacteria bacterium]|nr:hypothetical protein [Vicinamibacteria bacterium]
MPTSTGKLPEGEVPPGLPDVETLARLANQFFAGGVPSAAPPSPAASPGAGTDIAVPTPFELHPAPPAIPTPGGRDIGSLVPDARDSRTSLPVTVPGGPPSYYFLESVPSFGRVPDLPPSAHPPFDVHRVRRE